MQMTANQHAASIFGAVGLCISDMLLILTWFGHDFSARLFLSVRSFPFSCCPLSRALNVTLANLQNFGLSSIWDHHHLQLVGRSVRSVDQSWLLHYFILATPCWRDPTRSKRCSWLQFLAFSLNSIMSQYQPCIIALKKQGCKTNVYLYISVLISYLEGKN